MTIKNSFLMSLLGACVLLLAGCIQRKKKNLPRTYTLSQKAAHVYEITAQKHYTILTVAQTETDPSHLELKRELLLANDLHNKEQAKRLMANNPYKDLPLLQYKYMVDHNIARLHRYIRKIQKKAAQSSLKLEQNMQSLITQLEQLNNIIVVMPEYHQEKIKAADLQNSAGMKFLTSGIFAGLKKLIFL